MARARGSALQTLSPRVLRRQVRAEPSDPVQLDLFRAPAEPQRPRTRADCVNGPRPCPWISCKYHLFLDVKEKTGAVTLNHPKRQPWEMEESCALDVADRGGATVERVGELLNIGDERVRQLQVRGLRGLRRALEDDHG